MAACLASGDHDDYQNNVSGASKELDEIDNTFFPPTFSLPFLSTEISKKCHF